MSHFFLDTSYLLALELLDDQNHAVAIEHWRSGRVGKATPTV